MTQPQPHQQQPYPQGYPVPPQYPVQYPPGWPYGYQAQPPGQPTYQVQQPMRPEPFRMVAKARRDTSHGLHLFLTIITGGVWGLLVWFPLTVWHKFGPRRKTAYRQR